MLYRDRSVAPSSVGQSGPAMIPGFFAGKYAMLIGIGAWSTAAAGRKCAEGFHVGGLPSPESANAEHGDEHSDPEHSACLQETCRGDAIHQVHAEQQEHGPARAERLDVPRAAVLPCHAGVPGSGRGVGHHHRVCPVTSPPGLARGAGVRGVEEPGWPIPCCRSIFPDGSGSTRPSDGSMRRVMSSCCGTNGIQTCGSETRGPGCLIGLAVGDALGGPTEGKSRETIARRWGQGIGFPHRRPAGERRYGVCAV